MAQTIESGGAPPVPNAGRYRWLIVGLLFLATAINYVDRQMIGVLKPTLQQEMGWTEGDFATIVFWFQVAYAIGYIGFGRIVDIVGARLGYAVAITIWTISHMAHGLASSITQFGPARFGLGIGRSEEHTSELQSLMRLSYAGFCLKK